MREGREGESGRERERGSLPESWRSRRGRSTCVYCTLVLPRYEILYITYHSVLYRHIMIYWQLSGPITSYVDN